MEYIINNQEEKYNVITLKSFRLIECVAKAVILLCALLVVVYCIWTLNRGFEITDEAYYLLLAMHADSVKYYISAQQWITGGIWQITGSLANFRAAGMILLVTSSSLLAFGTISAFAKSKPEYAPNSIGRNSVVFAASIVCALLYAATINLSPCYNLLASAGAYAAVGLLLLALHSSVKWQQLGMLLLVGVALSIEFISKASAGLATLGLVMILTLNFGRSNIEKLTAIVAINFGLIASVLVILHAQTTIQAVANSINQGLELFRMVQVESVVTRLERYFIEFIYYSFEAIRSFAVLILIVVIYLITRRPIFIGFALVSLIYILVSGKYLIGGVGQYGLQMQSAIVLCAMVLLISRPVWQKNSKSIILIWGLIVLPYTVAVGTGNSLFTQVIVSLAPWGTAMGLIATSHFNNRADKIMVLILVTGFITATSLQIVTSGLRPYNMLQPITKQSEPANAGSLGSVKVDTDTKRFINDLKEAAKQCSISRGAPFLGLYNIPGVALVLETVPVLTPWLNNKSQAEFVIGNEHYKVLDSTVVALQTTVDGTFPLLPQQLSTFPFGYRYCGEAIFPYMHQKIQIWQRYGK